MLYEKGLQNLDSQFQILNHNLTELTLQKESELKAQAQLYLQVASQGDLQWQELCLKRELGLICPGEKVIILGDSEPKT